MTGVTMVMMILYTSPVDKIWEELSLFTLRLMYSLFSKNTPSIKSRAIITPDPVPIALPDAPYTAWVVVSESDTAFIRRNAARILTTALSICSTIWENEVGTMVPCAWKYPLRTPSSPEKKMVGAKMRSTGMELPPTSRPAPKKVKRLARPPTTTT